MLFTNTQDPDSDDESEINVAPEPATLIVNHTPSSPTLEKPKVIRALKKLTGFFNPEANIIVHGNDNTTSEVTSTGENSSNSSNTSLVPVTYHLKPLLIW